MTYKATDSEDTARFVAHLAKIQDHIFLDAYPVSSDADKNDLGLYFMLPTHVFWLVEQIEPKLTVRDMNEDWLNSYLAQNPSALRHDEVEGPGGENDTRLVITASTEELQAFIIEHLETEGAYSDPAVYHRVNEAAQTTQE
jgi:hypothetical protein